MISNDIYNLTRREKMILGALSKKNDSAFCVEQEDPKEQIDRVLFLTTGDSEPACRARETVNLCKNKNITILMGNSKSGKSTIVNALIGNKLTSIFDKMRGYVLRRVDGNDPSKGPVIGVKAGKAETSVPSAWCPFSELQSLKTDLLIDVPGFDDNRGAAQDIANALYISQILKNARSVKIILISDVNDIAHDNPKHFVDLIAKVHTIFSGSINIINSTSIVFSKCETKHVDNITAYIEEMANNSHIKIGKELLQHFLDAATSYGKFEKPNKEGPIELSKMESIAQVICNTRPVSLSENTISAGISSDSQVFLHQALSQFTDPGKIESFANSIKALCDKQIKECKDAISANNLEAIRTTKDLLITLQKSSPQPMSSIDLEQISEERCLKICQSLAELDTNKSINPTLASSLIQLVFFVDNILKTHGTFYLLNSINNILFYIDSQVSNCIDRADVALKIITDAEAREKQKTRDREMILKKAQLHASLNRYKKIDELVTDTAAVLDEQFVNGLGTIIKIANLIFQGDKQAEIEAELDMFSKDTNEKK